MGNIFLVGIFFDALVSGTVAVAALLFAFFLFRRWAHLDSTRRAYAWFWFFTMFTWVVITLRYLSIAFRYTGSGIYIGDIVVEGTIFFTGPPLFYYLTLNIFKKQRLSNCFTTLSMFLAFVALYFLLLPGGISEVHMTDFSADVSINFVSLAIFASEIALILGFIIYDILRFMLTKDKNHGNKPLYQLLYSLPLLIYVFLGAIDQSKIILDWPLVVFRVFYTSSFLFAYLVIMEEELQGEQYLVESKRP